VTDVHTRPSVTAIVPTHNRRSTLPQTLRSVLGQRDVDVEVIVVDDGSTEDVRRWLPAWAIERIRVIRHEVPRGAAMARTAAVDAATTDYVAFCDDDDLWAPDKVKAQLDAIAASPGAGWSCTAAVSFVTDRPGSVEILHHQAAPSAERALADLLTSNVVPGGGSSVLVAKAVIEDAGGFRADLAEDWDLWIRLALAAPMAPVSAPSVGYRIWRGTGRSRSSDFRGMVEATEAVRERYRPEAEARGVPQLAHADDVYLAKIAVRADLRREAFVHYSRLARRDPAKLVWAVSSLVAPSAVDLATDRRSARSVPREVREAALVWLRPLLTEPVMGTSAHGPLAPGAPTAPIAAVESSGRRAAPQPVVTVTIPSYNYARYLRECVESAVHQEGVAVDVVIVENASTDGSVELARQLRDEYPSVRLVEHSDNQGIICSMNRCRDEIRGDYVVLLCADDCLTPGSLARSVAFMQAHPDIGMSYGPVVDFTRAGDVKPAQLAGAPGPARIYAGADWIDRVCRARENPIRTPEVLVRASTLARAGRLDPACPHTSDLNMWLRIAAQADVAFLPGKTLALYRQHDMNHSHAYEGSALATIEQKWAAFSAFLDTVADRPEQPRWNATIRRNLAREARYRASRVYVRPDGAGAEESQQLLDLAARLDPSRSNDHSLSWRVRRKLGPDRSRTFPLFLPRLVLSRVERVTAAKRRVRLGV
jgi:glycosyltransferase involved in cell wall biosynthesis